ncbi:MAG TPA: class I SAM-dependent methyltransferase [Verrucomicrobiae bacterium]|nr:class I SAM-dependent methyltransferase [Verrucomicrobiae bacterium]
MAIEFNSVKFLLWAKNLGVQFTRVATLGHQGLACSLPRFQGVAREFGFTVAEPELRRIFQHEPCTNLYSDEFLRYLGAREITIVDKSDFEDANFLHDLNEPFPPSLRGTFDLVIDGGTLEHVFNYQAALKHCLELLRVGGHFVAVTPANGQMGHGFYQFSPELFFGIFNRQSGFLLRKIVLFELAKVDAPFYEVANPADIGMRVEFKSARVLQLALLAQKIADVPVLARPPQQSDYVAGWNAPRQRLDPSKPLDKFRLKLNPYLPSWLKGWKRQLVRRLKHGPMTLNNKRCFRRLSPDAIAQERANPAVTPSAKVDAL